MLRKKTLFSTVSFTANNDNQNKYGASWKDTSETKPCHPESACTLTPVMEYRIFASPFVSLSLNCHYTS